MGSSRSAFRPLLTPEAVLLKKENYSQVDKRQRRALVKQTLEQAELEHFQAELDLALKEPVLLELQGSEDFKESAGAAQALGSLKLRIRTLELGRANLARVYAEDLRADRDGLGENEANA